MTVAIRLDSVSVCRGPAIVVSKVSFAISQGSWFGLIGANGSGKTSLLRAIGGRLPVEAGGRCSIDGIELAGDRAARAERIGFAPPPERLPDAMRVGDLFVVVAGESDKARSNLGALNEALGLDGLADRWIGDCSAGMRQRVAIALAFVERKPIVILDEPFNWLDPVAAYDLRCVLRIMVDQGLTLITALHDLGTLVSACDEGAMLADGRVSLSLGREALVEAAKDIPGFEKRTIDQLRSTRN